MDARSAAPAPVTVLGLGAMGTALASAFLSAGHPTTVWNRTASRAEPLAAAGAAVAPTAAAAVAASPLVIACLLDYDAVQAVLDPVAPALASRALVNLTSATPEHSRQAGEWARQHGIAYLDGAIMVPTPMIGTPDAFILYSGSAALFEAHQATLATIAADSDYLGEEVGQAALYDLAMVDIYFAGMTSFLHAAALVGADRIPARTFLPYAQRIIGLLDPTVVQLAAEVDAGHYPGTEDNLVMELAATDHLVAASSARGIDTGPPELVRSLLRRAIAEGHGRDGFSRIVEQLRTPAS